MTNKKRPNDAISIQNLTVNYASKVALWDVTVNIPTGTLVGVIGPNGAGKSTLMKCILNLQKPTTGYVRFFNESLKMHQTNIAYVPQRSSIDWTFPITAIEVVMMGHYPKSRSWSFYNSKEVVSEATRWMDYLGMKGYEKCPIGELSGGQQQRLFMARALMQNADFYLLDEPFVGIDCQTEELLMDVLKAEKKRNKTILIVHHELATLKKYFDYLLMIKTRLIASGPTLDVLTKDNLERTYGTNEALFDRVLNLSRQKKSGIKV